MAYSMTRMLLTWTTQAGRYAFFILLREPPSNARSNTIRGKTGSMSKNNLGGITLGLMPTRGLYSTTLHTIMTQMSAYSDTYNKPFKFSIALWPCITVTKMPFLFSEVLLTTDSRTYQIRHNVYKWIPLVQKIIKFGHLEKKWKQQQGNVWFVFIFQQEMPASPYLTLWVQISNYHTLQCPGQRVLLCLDHQHHTPSSLPITIPKRNSQDRPRTNSTWYHLVFVHVHQNKKSSTLHYFTLLCFAAFSASSFFSDRTLTWCNIP